MPRRTKIVATIGPATATPARVEACLRAGADVLRINASHGSETARERLFRAARRGSSRLGRPVAIVIDLMGPKIRTGRLEGGEPVLLRAGAAVVVTTRDVPGNERLVSTSFRALPGAVKAGDSILLSDGAIELEVLRKAGPDVSCRVVAGGLLGERKGIHLPGAKLRAPIPTSKDRRDLERALAWGADAVALSFVRDACDVRRLRRAMGRRAIPVIAKIEKPEAVERLDEILDVSDAVMIARGDLGVEAPAEEVPLLQKEIIRRCSERGRPVITATQMLESMMSHPRPTRAEASDVANAVLDGSDAVMLSGETAAGSYPVESVRTMSRILEVTEASAPQGVPRDGRPIRDGSFVQATVDAACSAALASNATVIAVFTLSGRTAVLLSKQRPAARILALTPSAGVRRWLSLAWGVTAYSAPIGETTDEMLRRGETALLRARAVRRGEVAVIVAGTTPLRGATNMLQVTRLGST